MKSKFDSIPLGIILGLVAPFVGFIFVRHSQMPESSYFAAIKYMISQPGHRILSASLSLSLLANAVVFTIFLNMRKDKSAIGVFSATCAYGVLVLILKTIN